MSTRTKIVLALVGLLAIWFILSEYKKRKESGQNSTDGCKDLDDYEYMSLYQEKWNEQRPLFYRDDLPQQERWDFTRALRDMYRQEAYVKGGILPNTNDTESQISLYIIWKKAGEAMVAEGYCKKEIGGWKEFTNVY